MPELWNIGPKERAKRRIAGIGAGVLSIGLGYWMFSSDLPTWTRLLLALPIGFAVLCFIQAAAGT